MNTSLETKIVSQAPPYALIGENLDNYTVATIHGYRIGRDAIVNIDPEALEERPKTLELDPKTLIIAQLASLAIPQTAISKGFHHPVGNVGYHVSQALDAFEAPRRNSLSLAYTMWDIGYYKVAQSAEPLGLTQQEADVVELLSQGFSMAQADEQLKPKYGKDHRRSRAVVTAIGRYCGWEQTDAMVWRSIVGGDITQHAPATPSGW